MCFKQKKVISTEISRIVYIPPSNSTTVWMHHLDSDETHGEKAILELKKNAMPYSEQILEAVPHKNNCCTATYVPSHKKSEWVEQDMLETVDEVRTNS